MDETKRYKNKMNKAVRDLAKIETAIQELNEYKEIIQVGFKKLQSEVYKKQDSILMEELKILQSKQSSYIAKLEEVIERNKKISVDILYFEKQISKLSEDNQKLEKELSKRSIVTIHTGNEIKVSKVMYTNCHKCKISNTKEVMDKHRNTIHCGAEKFFDSELFSESESPIYPLFELFTNIDEFIEQEVPYTL